MSVFGWDYPPGVTGREYEIAGPDREVEEIRTCAQCDATERVTVQEYAGESWWQCDACGHAHFDLMPDFEPDEESER